MPGAGLVIVDALMPCTRACRASEFARSDARPRFSWPPRLHDRGMGEQGAGQQGATRGGVVHMVRQGSGKIKPGLEQVWDQARPSQPEMTRKNDVIGLQLTT